ncbi:MULTISPECIES: 2-C-methyl-D-erythritol 4-phosphate cytidylyltransferase [Photobacterium]|uniref:Ribitol-5-phosphate cytidylyltransferase n=1 Tax=Photobacterium angustum TaxID=661 RepID=A0ABX5GXR9_PHOAN|nr:MULTISPECIES: IspD/TarI family cytidylyltransferase [Photobacterium]KJG39105.1 2-C-methyl-D-erythritol 4-phosphate cytidylyltransferase [Photobacterium angustum]PSV39777.1 2-C-methyl-D-erythritol 4-phosphate cytidylyltransferase [Photobacterium sp. GB-210]PSX01048.1 2-C-methyl-D-erythritol 4-phosphate cytidylyltransferase [Photobacterium angustum]
MNISLIFAGGVGTRMGNKAKPKQFLELYGKPVIIYTLEHFENNDDVDAIVIVCKHEWIDYLKKLLERFNINKVVKVISGGETGQESIFNGIDYIHKNYNEDSIVLIHDGVRPLINQDIINKNIKSVIDNGSAITSCPPVETFVRVDKNNKVMDVHDRSMSRLAKAPQSFYIKDIYYAHKKAIDDKYFEAIDSCSLMRHYGFNVHLIDGISENIKITTPIDFYIFKAIVDAKEQTAIFG